VQGNADLDLRDLPVEIARRQGLAGSCHAVHLGFDVAAPMSRSEGMRFSKAGIIGASLARQAISAGNLPGAAEMTVGHFDRANLQRFFIHP